MPLDRLAELSDGPGCDVVDEPPLADPDVVINRRYVAMRDMLQ